MRKIVILFILTAFSLAGYSQDTINWVTKNQPFKVKKIAYADTMFLSGESMYGAYGSLFIIDSTADGRYFINDGYSANDSITQLRSEISDTATQIRSELADTVVLLRSDISDTATAVRSEISSSTYWNSAGGILSPKTSATDSVFIGLQSAAVPKSENVALQLYGQYNNMATNINPTTGDSVLNAKNGNTYFVDGTGAIVQINKCATGTRLLFSLISGATLELSPASFSSNGQILRTPSGSTVLLDEYNVIELICTDENKFSVVSTSGDNQ